MTRFLIRLVVLFILLVNLAAPVSAQTTPVTLPPTDDSYVSVSNPTSNYGTSTNLITSDYSSNTRVTYLKFDLRVYSSISQASLVLTPTSARAVKKEIYLVTDNSWTETTLNWNNKPATTVLVGALDHLQSALPVDVPVTIPLNAAALTPSLGNYLTLAILNTGTIDTLDIYSKENPVNQPYLSISTTPAPDADTDYLDLLSLLTQPTDIFAFNRFVQNLLQLTLPTPTQLPTPTLRPTATPVPSTPTPPPPTGGPTPTSPPATVAPTPTPVPPSTSQGIWLSPAEIAALPTSGAGWNNVVSFSTQNAKVPAFSDQNDPTDTAAVAKALVYARTRGGNCDPNNPKNCVQEVLEILNNLINANPIQLNTSTSGSCIHTGTGWDSLGVLRSLQSYPVAADLIDLKTIDPDLDSRFRSWLSDARRAKSEIGGPVFCVISGQEVRPNNFGTHGSASRIAADLYLGDTTDLNRAIQVYRGWLGDRSSYSGFNYGDLWWQANPSAPVGINPAGSLIQGHNVDGVLPDDQRRCGAFVWPPCKENYTWEALQGVVAAAEMLHRQGYPAFEWQNQALKRAIQWEFQTTFSDGQHYYPDSGDKWVVWIIDKRHGTNFVGQGGLTPGGSAGKGLGFADWSHQ